MKRRRVGIEGGGLTGNEGCKPLLFRVTGEADKWVDVRAISAECPLHQKISHFIMKPAITRSLCWPKRFYCQSTAPSGYSSNPVGEWEANVDYSY